MARWLATFVAAACAICWARASGSGSGSGSKGTRDYGVDGQPWEHHAEHHAQRHAEHAVPAEVAAPPEDLDHVELGGLPRQYKPEQREHEPGLVPPAVRTALCSVDVGQGTLTLMELGTSIRELAVGNCNLPVLNREAGDFCAVEVLEVVQLIAKLATFLATAASDCARTANLQAYCVGDIAEIVQSFAGIGVSAAALPHACNKTKWTPSMLLPTDLPAPVRRLAHSAGEVPAALEDLRKGFEELQEAEEERADRQVEVTNCFINVGMASFYISRAGLALTLAAKDCSPMNLRLEGKEGQMLCAVGIGALISSLSFVVQTISASVVYCAEEDFPRAECSGYVAHLVSEVASLASASADLDLACGTLSRHGDEEPESIVLPGRRLGPTPGQALPRLV